MTANVPASTFSPLDAFQVLIVPGRGNSGAHHWQSLLEAELVDSRRVVQTDWNRPQLESWARQVGEAAERAGKPVLVVAHSFGCLASVAAGLRHGAPIAGVLLVAPADPGRFDVDEATVGGSLPFASILVLSRDDPWLQIETGHRLGDRWGARIVDVGQAGHINVDSGHGHWPLARLLLGELAAELASTAPIRRQVWQAEYERRAAAVLPSRARRGTRRASARHG